MCALQWKDRCNYRCHSRRFLYSHDSYQVLARERLSMLVSDFTWKVGGMSSQFFFWFLKVTQWCSYSMTHANLNRHVFTIWLLIIWTGSSTATWAGSSRAGACSEFMSRLPTGRRCPPDVILQAAVDVQSYFSTNRGSPRKDKDLILQLKVFDWRNDLLWSTLQWLQ